MGRLVILTPGLRPLPGHARYDMVTARVEHQAARHTTRFHAPSPVAFVPPLIAVLGHHAAIRACPPFLSRVSPLPSEQLVGFNSCWRRDLTMRRVSGIRKSEKYVKIKNE